MPFSRTIAVFGLLLATLVPLSGQTGRLRMKVTDPLGARIAGAEVSLLGSDRKTVTRTVRSDRSGEAVLSAVPTGDINVFVSAPGFKNMIFVGLTIRSDDETPVDATLQMPRINIDYVDGKGPLPIDRVRVRVVDTRGVPIRLAHGWVISDVVLRPMLANEAGEILFTDAPPDTGIVIAADGFESKRIEIPRSATGDVVLR